MAAPLKMHSTFMGVLKLALNTAEGILRVSNKFTLHIHSPNATQMLLPPTNSFMCHLPQLQWRYCQWLRRDCVRQIYALQTLLRYAAVFVTRVSTHECKCACGTRTKFCIIFCSAVKPTNRELLTFML